MIMERVKTDDAIPYWDYDAPVTEETPRDASAAAVTAAGFIEWNNRTGYRCVNERSEHSSGA